MQVENFVKLFCYQHDGMFTTGNGVLVSHYLVTAAHVAISAGTLKLYHEGKSFVLSSNDAIYLKNQMALEEIADLAIFDVQEELSPLQFADDFPLVDQVFQSFSVRPSGITSCNVKLVSIERKVMLCKTDLELKEGSSGSPLILDGKLYGILIGGFPDVDKFLILYQPVSNILKNLQ